MQNLLTIPRFAAFKNVTPRRIKYLIDREVIIPEVIAGVKFINVDLYKELDANAAVIKNDDIESLKKSVTKLQGENKEFRKQLLSLKKIVLGGRR